MIVRLPYPPSTNRMWRIYNGRSVLSAEGAAFKRAAAWAAKAAGAQVLTGPVQVSMKLHPRTTAKGTASGTVLDLDNALKCPLDALQGVAYENDKQVKRLAIEYGEPLDGGGVTVIVIAY